MISAQDMITELKRNVGVIEQQTDGLTHDDSLLQLPFRGNCLNWVIGHMIVYRSKILNALGEEPFWDSAMEALYGHDSEPITDGANATDFEQMMADLKTLQARLEAALQTATDAQLDASPADSRFDTVRDRLAFFVWHDTYHTGQTEYLRQLAGIDDKVM